MSFSQRWQRAVKAWNAAEDGQDDNGMIARLRARPPMLLWVQSLDKVLSPAHDPMSGKVIKMPTVTMEALHHQAIAFRIPSFMNNADALKHVRQHWKKAWEQELESWTTDDSLWPKRIRATFDQWFDIDIIDYVMDLP